MKYFLAVCGLCLNSFGTLSFAADLPTVVEGSENYTKEQCIANYTNQCIESICPTSSSLDCSQKCKIDAEDKCQDQSDE